MKIDQIETPAVLIEADTLDRNPRTVADCCLSHHLSLGAEAVTPDDCGAPLTVLNRNSIRLGDRIRAVPRDIYPCINLQDLVYLVSGA